MDWVESLGIDWTSFINWFTNNVHDSSQSFFTDWDGNWSLLIFNFLTSNETFGGVHSNSSNSRVTQVLRDFENESNVVSFDFEGI